MKANKRVTIDDLLGNPSRSDKFVINPDKKGKPRILRKGKDINLKQPTEMYLNETELKAAGKEYMEKLSYCRVLSTDNGPLLVGGGKRVKSREPGMADQHLCIRGLFVAIEGKYPGKTLDPDQIDYKNDIIAAKGIFIGPLFYDLLIPVYTLFNMDPIEIKVKNKHDEIIEIFKL